jgi:hypothetical protein
MLYKMCVIIFSAIFLSYFLFSEELSEILQMYVGVYVKYPLFFSILIKRMFATGLEKHSNNNSPPKGTELFHTAGWADRQTDMTKLIAGCCSFMNAPKNGKQPHGTTILYLSVSLSLRLCVCRCVFHF